MKRSGWVLAAAGLALLLAPLCAFAAVKTRYVAPTGIDDSTEAGRGESAAYPFKTLAYAMAALPQAKADTNVVLRIFADTVYGTSYGTVSNGITTAGLNPRKPPNGGGRYFIYGNLDHPDKVQITIAASAKLCSTYTTWAGIKWICPTSVSLTFSENPTESQTYYAGLEGDQDWTGPMATDSLKSLRAYTRRRMRDTLRNCSIVGDLSIQGSCITVADVSVSGSIAVGSNSADMDMSDGSGGKLSRGRRRSVGVHLYNIDATADKSGSSFFWAGKRQNFWNDATSSIVDPARSQYVDSLRIWFSNFRSMNYTPTGGSNKASAFFNCTNLDLRGNEWRWHIANSEIALAHALRDSMDNTQMNCDTVVITGPGAAGQRMEWYENVSKSGGGRIHPIIDSSYFQAPILNLATGTVLGGTFTYTTFVSKLGIDLGDHTWIDSLQTVTFNHCNFIATGGTAGAESTGVFPIGVSGQSRTPYGWPMRGDSGNVFVFKNNIIARCDSTESGSYRSTTSPLVFWGWIGDMTSAYDPTGTRTVAKKINPNWNLYLSGGKYVEYGDRSIGWQGKGSYFGNYVRAASKPGASSTWKTFADSAAKLPNMTVAAKVASFDSLSVSGFVHQVGWRQWDADSIANQNYRQDERWHHVWTTGTKLDLSITPGSLAYGAGEGGSDIGAVAATARAVMVCLGDTCNNTITISDYNSSDTTVYIRIKNTGTAALSMASPIAYSPYGSYTASSTGLTGLAPGGVEEVPVTITDPTFDIPTGTYYITVVLTASDGRSRVTLNVTINKSVNVVE